jgi:hypothetical protein
VSRPLAFIAAILVGTTPAFLGHAFINPKDTIFASGLLWSLYLILYCFTRKQPASYMAVAGVGLLLGVVVSIRLSGIYLLFLVPVAAVLLPALRPAGRLSYSDLRDLTTRLRKQASLHSRRLCILFLTFAVAYTLAMPGILSDLRPRVLMEALQTFGRYPWQGTVLYFGERVPAQALPWHYFYGHLLVQMPLYYHFFFLVALSSLIVAPPMALARFAHLYRHDYDRFSVLTILLAALIVPLSLVLLVRPVLYDGLRHLLFVVPLLCLLLYLGFVAVMGSMRPFRRTILSTLALLCWLEAVFAMRSLHPYEYIYYNPLVNPAGAFELDYWATSFREVAERLNDYAWKHGKQGERLRLVSCGPWSALAPYLDSKQFEEAQANAPADLAVVLNRYPCPESFSGPWLFSVTRGSLVLAVVIRN